MLNLSQAVEIGTAPSGEPVTLAPMTAVVAARLGPEFSRIEPWVRYPLAPGALTKHLSTLEPGAPRYEIRVGRETGGTLTVRVNWLAGPYLQFLAVLPEFQRNGIGALALHWLENAARGENARNLWVAASDFNTGAIQLYERHGFKRVAAIECLLFDGRDEVLMRKRL